MTVSFMLKSHDEVSSNHQRFQLIEFEFQTTHSVTEAQIVESFLKSDIFERAPFAIGIEQKSAENFLSKYLIIRKYI